MGKNGAGKTTLMHMITGTRDLDEGERWAETGVSVGYLEQHVDPVPGQTIFDFVMERIEAEYKAAHEYKVDIVTKNLNINPQAKMDHLSGGQLRRAALARVLVEESDVLLMDEPTNHLDLEAIQWLENYLKSYPGTLLCVSHDRTFLANITDSVFWLDRGTVRVSPKGFKHFEDWSQELLEQEARELKNRKSIVTQEVAWASKGVKARRKRNVRRVEQMREMRDKLKRDESAYRRATKKISVEAPKEIDKHSKIVAEFYNVHKTFQSDHGDVPILEKFNLRIKKGDRIGILGKNGSGKTSFLKMLIGELEPDAGRVKLSKNATVSYFDQKRSTLNPKHSIKRTLCPQGGDYLDVNGKQRHVCGYLKDFMFDPADIDRCVVNLSGGEKNRLMLSKILAKPGNFLILDEPTNDLDMDTLDMLEEVLSQYKGTLFVVSHDRDFLDQTVSQILAFEGETKVSRHIGGYTDYLAAREASRKETKKDKKEKTAALKKVVEKPIEKPVENVKKKIKVKLSYKDKFEFEKLPEKIETLETQIKSFNAQLSDVDFYKRDPNMFHDTTKKLAEAQAKLERYEMRWLELDEMQN